MSATPSSEQTNTRATLKQVAQLADVSIATASKALNDRVHVRASTRQRVLDAAAQLRFSPNEQARSLSMGQTGTVGLITGDLEGRFSLPILMGAEDAFGTGRMSVFLCDARGDSIREQYHLDALLRRNVDGIIVVGALTNARKPIGRDLPVPVVYAYAPSEDPNDVSVVPNDVAAGADAVRYLLDQGRTRIAHISGVSNYTAAIERSQGVTAALQERGLTLLDDMTHFGSWSEQWGRSATERLIERHPDLDGIVCGNDQISRGALDALQRAGWNVPSRVALLGFDNWEVLTTGSRPQLSSVDLNFELVGREAASLLFGMMSGTVEPGIRRIDSRIVTRESA
ncbi:LacI family DNA-binding transcriptional regulator [Demequina aurantiaca]|uniref:LacI family DNA-binding transcriptional regulator n=1 Tax=Demequina aurantiaca TaxID=676200 RepID=UPI0007851FD9|nr:LacI family DNA-binding transcriptional regulator [Demequina aurantiaca]